MHVIIPLAGPDFTCSDGTIKPLILFKGQPLLKYILHSRPWSLSVKHYSFVLRDCEDSRRFARNYLCKWFDACSIIYLSDFTRGAAISSLAGVSMLHDFSQPLIVDLADIAYNLTFDINQAFASSLSLGVIAPAFYSNNPQYSYLSTDHNGFIVKATEKIVISDQASVGTYAFRNASIFLRSLAFSIENESEQTHNNLFYVCPLVNGVIAQGKQGVLASAFDVTDLKSDSFSNPLLS